jgi:hypothetical protein
MPTPRLLADNQGVITNADQPLGGSSILLCGRYGEWAAAEHVAQHSTAQHSTAQHSTAQHSTAQHSTAQHSIACHPVQPVNIKAAGRQRRGHC